MKKGILTCILFVFGVLGLAQDGYKKVYPYDEYNAGWALVKTISGTYGFINKEGTVVVEPIYKKINPFEYNDGQLAMVKNISGAYGFINRQGEVVVEVIYWTKEEAIEQLKLLSPSKE